VKSERINVNGDYKGKDIMKRRTVLSVMFSDVFFS